MLSSARKLKQRAIGKALSYPSVDKVLYKAGGLDLLTHLYLETIETDLCVPGKDTILCASRLHFARDIDRLRHEVSEFNWVCLSEFVLGRIQKVWVPYERRKQTEYNLVGTYLGEGDPYNISTDLSTRIIKAIDKKYPIKAILGANIDYWQSEGLRRACKPLRIPFLALCREAETIPGTYEALVDNYKKINYKYTGEGVAVFNERTRQGLIESGSCRPDQIVVTGAPRFDPWLENFKKPGLPSADRKLITLLSYFSPLYFAQKNFFEVVSILSSLREDASAQGLSIKLKCKGKTDSKDIQAYFNERDMKSCGVNFSWESDLLPVFNQSRIIIGFNSLAIIEAIFSNAIVIIPQWSDAVGDVNMQNINPQDPLAQKIYYFAHSAEEFKDLVTRAIYNELPPKEATCEDKIAFVNYYFSVDKDMKASRRVYDFIRSFIDRYHAAA